MKAVAMNFLGLSDRAADYASARIVVLSAPYEATCTYGRGASKGPEAIIRASEAAEQYDEELDMDFEEAPIATLPPPHLDNLEPEAMVEAVRRMTLPVIEDGKLIAGLGGEHTVTLGFLKALLSQHPSLTVLQIDAHPDMRDEYEGRNVCHATVGRRIMEICPVVQVGLRAYCKEERCFLEKASTGRDASVFPYSAQFIRHNPDWIDRVTASLGEEVYISLDLDGLDPTIIPHTGCPEPGGLSWREVCDLLAEVARMKKIVGFDVVELAPNDASRVSDFVAARLALRLMGHCLSSGRRPPGPPF